MNFLLVGHGGSYNRGCEAILRTTLALLRKEFIEPRIIISAFDFENEKNVDYGLNVTIIPAISQDLWKRFTKDWFKRQIYRIFAKNKIWELEYSPIMSDLRNSDCVLSVGGDNYTTDYGDCTYFLNLNKLIKKYRKKLVIWSASIGPFPENSKLKEVVHNLNQIDLITVREMRSLEYLRSIGVSKNVKLVADTAFLLESDTGLVEDVFSGIKNRVLGFNVSPILADYTTKYKNEDIIDECVLFLRRVMNEMKFHVLLIPHVTQNFSFNNDYNFMKKIYEKLSDCNSIMNIPSKYNAMQIKGIISKCDFFIGARTHSTIASLSTCVPTLSIGYSMKARGINEWLFGCDDFLVNVKDLSANLLFSKFIKLYDRECDVRNALSSQAIEFKRYATKNIEYLKEILR